MIHLNAEWYFFDLDGTLWDHDAASTSAIHAVCAQYGLAPMSFLPAFRSANEYLWRELSRGGVDVATLRIRRFEMALESCSGGCCSNDAEGLSHSFMASYRSAAAVMPGAREAVLAAAALGKVAIATNGPRDAQDVKLADLQLPEGAIQFMQCLDDVTALKPHRSFFDTLRIRAGNVPPDRCVMIGDSWEEDAMASHEAGLHACWLAKGRRQQSHHAIMTHQHIGDIAGLLSASPQVRVPATRP